MATMPWGLIVSALVVAAIVAIVVIKELRRDRRQKRELAKIEQKLPKVAATCQRQFEKKFGRPSSELESSFPSLSGKRGP